MQKNAFSFEPDPTVPAKSAGDLKVEDDEEAFWMEVSGWWGAAETPELQNKHSATKAV